MYYFNDEMTALLLKWEKEGYIGQKWNQVEPERNSLKQKEQFVRNNYRSLNWQHVKYPAHIVALAVLYFWMYHGSRVRTGNVWVSGNNFLVSRINFLLHQSWLMNNGFFCGLFVYVSLKRISKNKKELKSCNSSAMCGQSPLGRALRDFMWPGIVC